MSVTRFVVSIEDRGYIRFDRVLDKHRPEQAENFKHYGGDGTSEQEQSWRKYNQEIVDGWFTQDINDARLFESEKSARNAASRGPFQFEILEVSVKVSL